MCTMSLSKTDWLSTGAFRLLGLGLFLLFPLSAGSAERTLTLDACIRTALERNKDILRAQHSIAEMRAALDRDYSERMPQVSLAGDYAAEGQVGTGEGPDAEQYVTDLKLSQEILRFGEKEKATSDAERGLRKARFAYQRTGLDVFYDVRRAFFSYLLTADEIEQRREILKEFRRKHERMQMRLSAGKVKPIAVKEAELEVMDERLRINDLKRRLREQKLDLLGKIGILEEVQPEEVEITGEIFEEDDGAVPEDSLDAMIQEAFGRRTELADLEADIREARERVRDTYWRWSPDFSARAVYTFERGDIGLNLTGQNRTWRTLVSSTYPLYRADMGDDSEEGAWTLRFGLNIPLFDGFDRWGVYRIERARLERLILELERRRNQVALGVTNAFYALLSHKERMEIEEKRAQVTRERLEIIENLIELPVQSFLTFDDILRQRQAFVQAQKKYFQERFNYVMAGEDLRKTIGRMHASSP